VAARLTAQNNLDHYTKKIDEEKKKVEKAEELAAEVQAEFEVSVYSVLLRCHNIKRDLGGQSWTAKAMEYCERFENPRKPDIVKRNLDSVQKALQEREKRYVLEFHYYPRLADLLSRHGATVEEMTIEVNRTKANLDTAEKDLKNMFSLNKVPSRC
jgi:hypothetical protein